MSATVRAPGDGTVLVTGGAGFVGSALVRRLLDGDRRVVVLDNFFSGPRENVEGLGDGVVVLEGDVLDEAFLDEVFATRRPDRVYHLVGDTFVPSAYREPRRFFRINVEGTLNVLEACARHGVGRMLYVSSTEVYGRAPLQPIREDGALDPANTYAVSKLAADRLCHTFVHEHGVPVRIARIFNCYGPRETQPYVVPEVIRQLARGPVVALGNPEARRDFTYVDDTARGLEAVMEADLPDGDVCHVGSGTSVSIRELVGVCGRLMGHAATQIVEDPRRRRALDVEEFRADATRLRALSGWAPRVGLEEGLARTIGVVPRARFEVDLGALVPRRRGLNARRGASRRRRGRREGLEDPSRQPLAALEPGGVRLGRLRLEAGPEDPSESVREERVREAEPPFAEARRRAEGMPREAARASARRRGAPTSPATSTAVRRRAPRDGPRRGRAGCDRRSARRGPEGGAPSGARAARPAQASRGTANGFQSRISTRTCARSTPRSDGSSSRASAHSASLRHWLQPLHAPSPRRAFQQECWRSRRSA